MILECPNCQTCYETPAVLPEEGRKVKCARCSHVWHAMPTKEPEPEPETEPDPEPELEEFPEEVTEPESFNDTFHSEIDPIQPEVSSEEDEDIAFREAMMEPPSTLPEEEKFEAIDDVGAFGKSEEEPEVVEEFGAVQEDVASEPDPFEEALKESETETKVPDIPVPPTMVSAPKDDPRKVIIGWSFFVATVFAFLVLASVFRVEIVRALPTSAHIYAALGVKVNTRGLDIINYKHKLDTEKGRPVLRIAGEIVNITNNIKKVPTIVFAFKDKSGAELYHWTKKVKTQLIPGRHQLPFSFELPNPSKHVHSVEIRFAKGGREY